MADKEFVAFVRTPGGVVHRTTSRAEYARLRNLPGYRTVEDPAAEKAPPRRQNTGKRKAVAPKANKAVQPANKAVEPVEKTGRGKGSM